MIKTIFVEAGHGMRQKRTWYGKKYEVIDDGYLIKIASSFNERTMERSITTLLTLAVVRILSGNVIKSQFRKLDVIPIGALDGTTINGKYYAVRRYQTYNDSIGVSIHVGCGVDDGLWWCGDSCRVTSGMVSIYETIKKYCSVGVGGGRAPIYYRNADYIGGFFSPFVAIVFPPGLCDDGIAENIPEYLERIEKAGRVVAHGILMAICEMDGVEMPEEVERYFG